MLRILTWNLKVVVLHRRAFEIKHMKSERRVDTYTLYVHHRMNRNIWMCWRVIYKRKIRNERDLNNQTHTWLTNIIGLHRSFSWKNFIIQSPLIYTNAHLSLNSRSSRKLLLECLTNRFYTKKVLLHKAKKVRGL